MRFEAAKEKLVEAQTLAMVESRQPRRTTRSSDAQGLETMSGSPGFIHSSAPALPAVRSSALHGWR